MLACEVGDDVVEIRVAELRLTKGRHDRNSLAYDRLDEIGGQVRALCQQCRFLTQIFGAQGTRAGFGWATPMADGAITLELGVTARTTRLRIYGDQRPGDRGLLYGAV